jgi:hypothetical protein
VVQDHHKTLTGLAILGTTKTEIQDKVKRAVSNNTIPITGISDREVPDVTIMTEGEMKIREGRDRETLHTGMPQLPLSENRGLIGIIIQKTNHRKD